MANLADLQAELLKKKTELKQRTKLGEGNFIKAEKREGAKSIFSSKNKGVDDRHEKDLEQKQEEAKSLENSRKKLEMKAKLYDKLSRGENGVLDDDKTGLEDRVMVDFQQKALDHLKEENQRKKKEANNKKIKDLGGGKVEFTDSLGRSRIVDKEDVKDFQEMDKDLRGSTAVEDDPYSTFQKMKFIKSHEFEEKEAEKEKLPEVEVKKKLLVSSDMTREELRQKWEQEEIDLMQKGDVHFQDVLFDEVRDLGTGYFGFSTETKTREKQKEELSEMRDETLTSRERAERVKAKRADMMKARLAKVKARRGIEDDSKAEEVEKKNQAEEEEEEKRKKEKQQRLFEHHMDLARRAKIREWDQGKEATLTTDRQGPSWESKTEEMRDSREPDFAPPNLYGANIRNNKQNNFKRRKKAEDEEEEEDPLSKGLRNIKNLYQFP